MDGIRDEQNHEQGSYIQTDLLETLGDLFEEYQPSFERYQWPVESLRWNALALSILETLSSEVLADAAASAMTELDLLAVEKLAQLADTLAEKRPSARARLIVDILREAGFEEAAAKEALIALVEAAEAIQSQFQGKVQQLLRREGQQIIQEVARFFRFSSLDDESVQQVITRWLQDVLNLPVYLETEASKAFCTEMNSTVSELIAAADELDINVALADELVHRWHEAKTAVDDLATGLPPTNAGGFGATPGDQEREQQDE